MKLLLFSDVHCDTQAAHSLVEQAQGVDAVVGAGDFATARRGLEQSIDVLRAIGCPTVLVPGNAESFEELSDACAGWSSATVLHGAGTTIAGVPFFGLGGAVPVTPFGDWSYDFTDEQAAELLSGCPAGGVLVTHSPPRGAADRDSAGRFIGSTAVRKCIDVCAPRLVVCGHVHASWGQTARLRETTVINAGPQGTVFELT